MECQSEQKQKAPDTFVVSLNDEKKSESLQDAFKKYKKKREVTIWVIFGVGIGDKEYLLYVLKVDGANVSFLRFKYFI